MINWLFSVELIGIIMAISDNNLRYIFRFLVRSMGWVIGVLSIEVIVGAVLFTVLVNQPDRLQYEEITRLASPSGDKVLVAYFHEGGVLGPWFVKVDVEDQSGNTMIERLYVMDKCQFVTLHWWNDELVDISGSTLRLGVDSVNTSSSNPKTTCPSTTIPVSPQSSS